MTSALPLEGVRVLELGHGLEDLLADERLDDNAKRVAARDWLPGRIALEMRRYSSGELSERLERARVPFAPLRRPS